jgi:hypothetical protein
MLKVQGEEDFFPQGFFKKGAGLVLMVWFVLLTVDGGKCFRAKQEAMEVLLEGIKLSHED